MAGPLPELWPPLLEVEKEQEMEPTWQGRRAASATPRLAVARVTASICGKGRQMDQTLFYRNGLGPLDLLALDISKTIRTRKGM